MIAGAVRDDAQHVQRIGLVRSDLQDLSIDGFGLAELSVQIELQRDVESAAQINFDRGRSDG